MNKIFAKITIISLICLNGLVKISSASPKDQSISSSPVDESSYLTVDSVDFLMDGGSVMFECADGGRKFRVILQRPHKEQPQSFVRVLTVEDFSKPNLTNEIVPDSCVENRLLDRLSDILKRRPAPKFEREIKTAIKYISDRSVPWSSSDWIPQK